MSAYVYTALLSVHVAALAKLTQIAGTELLRHVTFVVLSCAYALLANITAPSSARITKTSLTRRPKIVRLLFPFTLLLSITLPWWMLLGDPLWRSGPPLAIERAGIMIPTQLARMVVPHLFLIHSQLIVETFSFVFSKCITTYVRIALPIAYVSYRLPVIFQWWRAALAYEGQAPLDQDGAILRSLAVANGIFWSFALFGFLLPYVLPSSFVEPDFRNPTNISSGVVQTGIRSQVEAIEDMSSGITSPTERRLDSTSIVG